MATLMMSLPISILFIYGFLNICKGNLEGEKQAETGMTCINDGSWLAKGWLLAIISLTLILSITGI